MKLIFLANPASPHVRLWINHLAPLYDIDIWCLGESWPAYAHPANVRVICPFGPLTRGLPKLLRYALLGWRVRRADIGANFVHAHNTSGYGFAALCSGHRFVVTTYGSEIFSAPGRGWLYNALIGRILRRARQVIAECEAMASFLTGYFRLPAVQISTFNLGVAVEFEGYAEADGQRDPTQRTWFANRRILPLYCTLELVRAFIAFREQGGTGQLVLMKGDAAGDYFEQVLALVTGRVDVTLIEAFLSATEIRTQLRQADYTISIPKSDQLSVSILEGMSQGAVPVLRPLESYRELKLCAVFIDSREGDGDGEEAALVAMFRQTAALELDELRRLSREGVAELGRKYSASAGIETYKRMVARLTRGD